MAQKMRKLFSLALILSQLVLAAQESTESRDSLLVHYRVQVGAFQKPSDLMFNGFQQVHRENEGGVYKYTVGFFEDFEEAVIYRDSIRVTGYPGAFVVGYVDGKRSSLKEIETYRGSLVVAQHDTVQVTQRDTIQVILPDTLMVPDKEVEVVETVALKDSASVDVDIELMRQKLNRITWMKVALGQTALVGGVALSIVTGAWVPVMMGVAVVEIYLLTESKYRFNRRDLRKITGY